VVAIEELRADELGHPRRRALPRTAQVATDGVDIGVALGVPDDHSCLLGARISDAEEGGSGPTTAARRRVR
jgi:hypothetical protein